MRPIAVLALLPSLACAEEFSPLSGAEITEALTGVTLTYEDGAVQTFYASGRTLYDNGRPSWGTWAVRGNEYCSQWPPADGWACYAMDGAGELLRFVGESGDVSAGMITR
ncbi:MAG: hypothetical protein AAFQ54_01190 [Pseudomonadota bacterium]